MSKLARLIEAERRGVLTGRALSILQEARARGLAAEPRDPVAEAVREVGAQNRAVIDAITRAVEGIRPPSVTVSPAREPVVQVEAVIDTPAPVVHVQPASAPTKWRFSIERDRSGYITAITAEAAE